MRKLLLIPFTIFFISCTNSDEKFGIWMKENNGLEFTSEHMDFLVSEYGEPIDTINNMDDKIPVGFNINLFYGPEFIDIDDSNYYIEEYKEKQKKIQDIFWYKDNYGERQLKKGRSFAGWENESGFLLDEFRDIYMAITGYESISQYDINIQAPWTVREFITEYQRKVSEFNDEISFEEAKNKIIGFFYLDGKVVNYDLNSITYRFKTITTSSKDYWPNTDNPKEIDVYRDVKITDGKINFNEGMFFDMNGLWDENWCISEKSKRKITNNVVGDWAFRKNGRVVAAYKFFEDYTFSMSSASGTLRGGWSINCNGQISRTEQGGNTINIVNTNEIEENGIYYLKE